MTEYALLWVLWLRALQWRLPLAAVAIVLAYAATDELHQHFVRDRHGAPVDWLIDAAGMSLGIAAYASVRKRQRA
jgi:VanZ family protein